MTATDQQILNAAKDRLLDIINGRVAEFYEGNDRARMLEIEKLETIISKYEAKVAATSNTSPIFRPIR